MRYISTRGESDPLSFSEAVMTGLARDGGLLLPESIPQVGDRLDAWAELAYPDLAFEVMRLFADLPDDDLRGIVQRSYAAFDTPEVTPLRPLGDGYLLELFHGPTLAFKDVALQFLGNLFEYLLERSGGHMNIVAATSGDTGSAAICGVRGMERIRIFVMHPDGKTSEIQRLQMTTVLDDNVFNLAVRGSFDDCQRMLKEVFNDLDFKDGCSLGAVNSINWARVLAQVVYYFYASLRVCRERGADRVRFSVPTGNFGDIFAGYIAAKMGAPIGKLVLATNENDILARFFNSGEYSCGEVVPTISPSMDIQVASNFERYLYYRLDCDTVAVRDLMRQFGESGRIVIDKCDGAVDDFISAGSGTTELTLEAIAECCENTGIVLDPHTAVGYSVGRCFTDEREPMIFLATAHPAKFGDAIRQALGDDAAGHPRLERLRGMPSRYDMLDADSRALKEYILRHI